MKDIPVSTVMTQNVELVAADLDLLNAFALLRDHHGSCLVVTDGQRPVGIVTERDAVRALVTVLTESESDADRWTIADYMSRPPVTVNTETSIIDALVLIQSRRIRHLPVTDDSGKLRGVITPADLIRNEQEIFEKHDEIVARSVENGTRQLQRANEELRALSLEDPLLGIGNRRSMEIDLQYTHKAALRYERPYAVVVLDVDYFKKYNDMYGHKKGDDALKFVAGFLQEAIREADRVYRYGGEEFLLLLPETGLDGAETMTARLVQGLHDQGWSHGASPYGVVTISAGIAAEEPHLYEDTCWQRLVCRADEALYAAKNKGRNQYAVSGGKGAVYNTARTAA